MTTTARYVSALLAPAVIWAASSWSPALRSAPAAQQVFDAGLERQAIFPVYDGYTRNSDGSLTLAFAYFSHNAEPVTIPPGPANAFSPGPADRGQPTTFLPGHHRWQCIMVVGPEFDGGLRWTLSHGGATRETSSSMLQYNWEFTERDIGSVLRGIEDPAAAPRGVCLKPFSARPRAGLRRTQRPARDARQRGRAAQAVRQRAGRRTAARRRAQLHLAGGERPGRRALRRSGAATYHGGFRRAGHVRD